MNRLKAFVQLVAGLQPALRLLLLLGAALIPSAMAAAVIGLLGGIPLLHGPAWPAGEAVALSRIESLTILGGLAMGCVIVVVVALAWGQVDRVSVSAGGVSANLEFEGDPGDPAVDEKSR